MAEKTSELRDEKGILSDSDRDVVSTVAGAESGDEFLEKYSEPVNSSLTARERGEIERNTGSAPDETEHIKAQIEETRSQMGETIDAIQEKLSLTNISEQVKEQVSEHITSAVETVKDSVYEATIGKVRGVMKHAGNSNIVKTASANPFPFVLIGLGVGLLFFSGKKRNTVRGREFYSGRETGRRRQHSMLKSTGETVSDAASTAYESVGSAASGAYKGVSNVAGSAYEGVTSAAGSAYEGVTSAASTALSSVTDAAQKARHLVGDYSVQAREQYDHYIEENPLAVGALALALGAVVGAAIPSTRYESKLIGDYREQVVDKVQHVAGDLVNRVKEVAAETRKTISEEVKTAVDETKQTIKDEAKTKGLT